MFSRSDGGLATSMADFTDQKGTVWIGWPGIVNEDLTSADKKKIIGELDKKNCRPVFLSRAQYEDFYNGYSNSVLWPALHTMPVAAKIPESWWRGYRQVNEMFAGAIKKYLRADSAVWIHDYQLLLLPLLLRRQSPKSSIGLFMHIPFPTAGRFIQLKEAPQLVRGMLGADLVGFHTNSYEQFFLDTCTQLNIGVTAVEQVILANRVVRVANLPIGIDAEKYAGASNLRAVRKQVRRLRRRYGRLKVILTIDRLDPIKAFPERLKAYRTFLEEHPEMRQKVVLVMIAVPSRSEIPAYQKLKQEVDTLVADINGTYGTRKWRPIDFRYESIPFEEITALYRIADVAFVASLIDGMNLVAKEFVASKTDSSGVLILSRNAGAAVELSDALLVNPSRHNSLVQALEKALTMSPDESKIRLLSMQKVVSANNVQMWAASFMNTLKTSSASKKLLTRPFTNRTQKELIEAFRAAKSPLLLFDYDGVMTPFFNKPEDAKPTADLLKTLRRIGRQKDVDLAIISGRRRSDLSKWFGKLPVTLAAEHGAKVRLPGREWQTWAGAADTWKKAIKPIFDRFADLTPGALVEEKSYSLVWHYRAASPYYAQKHLVQLRVALQPFAKKYRLGVYLGKKILEIKPPSINKGAVVTRLLRPQHDFILAIGDDYTDEHMFALLPDNAYSIKVGPGRTEARYRAKSTAAIQHLLEELAG